MAVWRQFSTIVDNMRITIMHNKVIEDMQDLEIAEFLRESNAIEGEYGFGQWVQALHAWTYLSGQDILTVPVVLKTHNILMKGLLPVKDRGRFRHEDVMIGGRLGLRSEMIAPYMQQWVFELAKHPYPPEENKKLHVQYEHIHPFIDGNGRTGRMFYLYMAIKHKIPFEWITEREKYQYYQWF